MLIPPGRLAVGFFDDVVAQHQNIHAAFTKGVERLFGCVNDGLTPEIERSVENHRHTGSLAECFNQAMVSGIGFLAHRLQPAGAIHMGNRRQRFALVFFNVDRIFIIKCGDSHRDREDLRT